MKQALRHYAPVALLLAAIIAVSGLITMFTARPMSGDGNTVVATVYPLYLAAKNVVGDTSGITVQTLTGATAGCLHDYQLSPADRLRLQNAQLVLLNGAGAEAFLDDIIDSLHGRSIDTSAGLALLAADCHDHHQHADHEHGSAYNEHVWSGASYYAAQVQTIVDALCAIDPNNATAYTENGEAYRQQILAVGQRLQKAVSALPTRECIIFHDSLAYLAADAGLTVEQCLTIGEDAGVSVADLTAASQLLTANPHMLILYDSQYTARYTAIDSLVPARQVLALDTGVTGDGRLTDWLDAMNKNATLLEGLTEGNQ